MGAQAVRLSNVDIDNAIKNKDFEVLFQPIFDLGNGALARMETFVRWRHKTLGLLPPGAFISFFETQGRMSELTRYVLAAALDAYTGWRGAYAPGFSINLALSDLGDEAFAAHFQKLLRDRAFPADLVTLECPMPPVDMDADIAAAHFKTLSETGARLAIEVRGRANEFLRTVDPFPFDEIKTGGASILRFARTVRGPGLSAIADLLDIANRANAAITAVGVEDQTSLAALRGLGFTAAQGNHLAKVGGLKEFKPSKVNDVRTLLKLEPLDNDSLGALFRTATPGAKAGVLSNTSSTGETTASEETETDIAAQEEERKTKAREKARKLALAKRAKTRETRKAAAIERVKSKAASQSSLPGLDLAEDALQDIGDPFGPSLAPRDLQKRIAEEFGQQDDDAESEAELTTTSEAALPEVETPPAAPAAQSPEEPSKKAPPKPKKRPAKANAKEAKTEERAAAKPATQANLKKPEAAKTATTSPPLKEEATKPAASLLEKLPNQEKVQGLSTTNKILSALKMSIPKAGAKLLPVINVAGPQIRNTQAQTQDLPQSAAPLPNAEQPEQLFDAFAGIRPVRKAQAQTVEESVHVDTDTPALTPPAPKLDVDEDIPLGDLHRPEEEEGESQPSQTDNVKSKNFLTRKYQVVPTHFWPKSWKRRFREMKAKNAAVRKEVAFSDSPSTAD